MTVIFSAVKDGILLISDNVLLERSNDDISLSGIERISLKFTFRFFILSIWVLDMEEN